MSAENKQSSQPVRKHVETQRWSLDEAIDRAEQNKPTEQDLRLMATCFISPDPSLRVLSLREDIKKRAPEYYKLFQMPGVADAYARYMGEHHISD